jgi:predicted nucleic acid-binding protein
MGVVVLDAGVVIALLERRDAHHEAALAAVAIVRGRGDRLLLPASAYSEVLVRPSALGPDMVLAVDGIVDALPADIVAIDRPIAAKAARLRARYGRSLRLPDALVLATAEAVGADLVLSTDADLDGRGYPVTILAVG